MPETDEISDGFHTFAELYAHRHALFIALTRLDPDRSWRSRLHHDGTSFGEARFIAGMDLPTGTISYHLPADRWPELDHVGTLERAPEWDGHTPDDVVRRLLAWQPVLYPTADAYVAACATLEQHRARADRGESEAGKARVAHALLFRQVEKLEAEVAEVRKERDALREIAGVAISRDPDTRQRVLELAAEVQRRKSEGSAAATDEEKLRKYADMPFGPGKLDA